MNKTPIMNQGDGQLRAHQPAPPAAAARQPGVRLLATKVGQTGEHGAGHSRSRHHKANCLPEPAVPSTLHIQQITKAFSYSVVRLRPPNGEASHHVPPSTRIATRALG